MNKCLKILLVLLVCIVVFSGCADNQDVPSESGYAINQGSPEESEDIMAKDDLPGVQDEDKQGSSAVSKHPDKDKQGSSSKSSYTDEDTGKSTAAATSPYYCTLLITCSTIFDNMDDFDQSKLEVLPEDGIVYTAEKVEFHEGDSAFDVLLRETRAGNIHMEFVNTPIYNSAYIEGINNIYEFDAGPLSGWMYRVNEKFPNYGSSRYQLVDGDRVEWIYTCNLGRDIGGDWNAQNGGENQ
ncbi:MAG: DUF4430 domain-containing protein [Eubacteriales bacterium]|nr:DUF4430 domain-containing protein [Eubacteriales bacterium]MDD3199036.1 DUF4430 domain-containing protein [Eubacteriales bacterium]MDD4121961.1 DUF4430 domain-containing protein [Eubacteriales bacterium]MDD4629478.1 DUF4430 domain-containing protein [Eubacteriales bacterium]